VKEGIPMALTADFNSARVIPISGFFVWFIVTVKQYRPLGDAKVMKTERRTK
jgi:hypothetical protein